MRFSAVAAIGLVAAALLLSGGARAQIVDVQSKFASASDQGLHAAIEGAIDWRTGSNDLFALRGGVTAHYRSDPHLLLFFAQAERGFSQSVMTMNRTLGHLRHRFRFTRVLSSELFIQHEYNAFRRLELRGLVGAGPRFDIIDNDEAGLAIGVAAMLGHERLRTDDLPDAGAVRTDVRLSTYVMGRYEVMEDIALTETLYFQPRADFPADYRVLSDSSLVFRVNRWIGLTAGFTVTLDRFPPAGVSPLDTALKGAIAVTL